MARAPVQESIHANGASRPWPVLRSLQGYRPNLLTGDLVAGATLAAIAIPEQMATARLGSLGPQIGFFAFIAASGAFLIFGSNRRLSAGADSTITPIFAGALALLASAGSPHYVALAAGLALLVGILVTLAGVLKMGWIGSVLSIPVTIGFLAGIAGHIVVSQLPAALGVPAPSGSTLQKMAALARLAPATNLVALAISAGVLALTAASHRISPRLPGPLLAVGLATGATAFFHLDRLGVALLGQVPAGLPGLSLPAIGAGDYLRLLPLALLVSLVVMVQTAATTRSFTAAGQTPDESGDFLGVGAANILAGCFGAFPVDASPPRTGIVAESGGQSQLASAFAAILIIGLLAFGVGALKLIPEAALSGVLLFVALRILRVGQMRQVLASSPAEALLILITAAAILCLPIESGVAVGVTLSLVHGLWSQARTRVHPMHRLPGVTIWWPTTPAHPGGETVTGVTVLTFQAPLTFLSAEVFSRDMLQAIHGGAGGLKLVILEAAGVVSIDFTAADALKEVVAACRAAGAVFAVARLESVAAQAAFARLGLTALIGEDHIFDSVAEAITTLGPDAPLPDGSKPG